ncbi:MAG: TrbG/VirB9 family P-type conjugative transfer protein [Acetobacteraceae bacterium]
MTRRGGLMGAAILSLMLSTPAFAVEYPKAGSLDSRIRYVPYEAGNVVDIWTAPGAAMAIEFAPTEVVQQVVESDSAFLQAKPAGNFVFFKPMGILSAQPVLIVTRRAAGSLRRYTFQFETVQSKLGAGANVDYTVVFTYPADAEKQRLAVAKTAAAKAEQRAARTRLAEIADGMKTGAVSLYGGQHNYRYAARGDHSLAPAEVSDDGYSTVFVFPGNERIPAILRIDPDGKEAVAQTSVHGDAIVATGTAREWVLRDGRAVLNIYDLGYSSVGTTPGTHTISPSVVRTLRDAGDAG